MESPARNLRFVSPVNFRMRLGPLILSLLSLSPCALGSDKDVSREACISFQPVYRKARPSCWVELDTSAGDPICVSRPLWRSWLSTPTPPVRCGQWRGHWRVTSPPQNSPPAPKLILHRFVASRLPLPKPETLLGNKLAPISHRAWLELERIREDLSTQLRPLDPLGIYRQLLLNERSPDTPGNTLRLLGFVHLLSVTGIHLYAMSDLLGKALFFICNLLELPLSVGLALSRFCSVFSWIAAWLLAGARAGMLRPLLIVSIRRLALNCGFRWRRWSPLVVALLIDLAIACIRPSRFPMSSGRILYALAVGGGLCCQSPSRDSPHNSSRNSKKSVFLSEQLGHLRLAVGSWLLVAFWDCWLHQILAPLTPIFSYLTIPVFALFVYPLLFLQVFCVRVFHGPEIALFGTILKSVTSSFGFLLERTLNYPILWSIPRHALLLGILGVLLLSLRGKRPDLKAGIVLLALALAWRALWSVLAGSMPLSNQAPLSAREINQLDIGQGDAALVLATDGSAGMIDVGPERALSDEAWLLFFLDRGIHALDWVALTHLDQDHAGGLQRLAQLIPIRCVATSEAELGTTRGKNLAEFLAANGVQVRKWDSPCVPFPTLGPAPGSRAKANANMSAILIPLQGGGFYFSPGDADARDERFMARWKALPAIGARSTRKPPRILKVSHHGAKTSSSTDLLKAIAPTEAWISVGVGNRYGHPSVQVLEKLSSLEIPLKRTDREGLIRWTPRTKP